MHIGIVGSQGFIGRNLCDVLQRQNSHKVYKWMRPKDGDFLIEEHRERFLGLKFDLVFQLAWTNVNDPKYRTQSDNRLYALASINFAHACQLRGTKLVLMSSSITNHEYISDNYTKSKRFLEDIIRESSFDNVSLVKPTIVFSIEERRPHLLRQFISWIESGKTRDTFEIKTPSELIEVIEVRDLAISLTSFINSDFIPGIYKITSGFRVTVEQFIQQLSDYLNGLTSHLLPESTFVKSTSLNSEQVVYSRSETLKFFS